MRRRVFGGNTNRVSGTLAICGSGVAEVTTVCAGPVRGGIWVEDLLMPLGGLSTGRNGVPL